MMRKLLARTIAKMGIYPQVISFLNKIIARREAANVRKHGVDVLRRVDEILTPLSVRPFLSYGLLLGAYREKGFIPYDYDIDLGILASERPDNFVEIMRENGFEPIRQFYYKDDKMVTIDQFIYHKVPVDFYIYYENETGGFSVYLPERHEFKDWVTANNTDGFPTVKMSYEHSTFSRQDFLGLQLYMPDKAKEWLEANYGSDFMTPIKNWSEGEHKTARRPYPKRQYRNEAVTQKGHAL